MASIFDEVPEQTTLETTPWFIPDLNVLGDPDDVADWWFRQCPFYQACNGGPRDLPGAYGPGTCASGCSTEPACMM